jgi:hypothetical protein
MTVKPTLSRGFLFEVFARIRIALRDYFVTSTEHPRGAVILSFRRHGAPAVGFRGVVAEQNLVNKKGSGSVRWNGEHERTPQEGGRG